MVHREGDQVCHLHGWFGNRIDTTPDAQNATKRRQFASHPKKVTHVSTTLELLKAKRSSAVKDARKIEVRLARLKNSGECAGVEGNLRCIDRMFREYIASLDEAIKLAHPRRPKNSGLSA